jgi:hypothetical protein
MRSLAVFFLLLLCLASACAQTSQDWSGKPIAVSHPAAAGGSTQPVPTQPVPTQSAPATAPAPAPVPAPTTAQPFIAGKGKIAVKIDVVEQSAGMQGKYQYGGLIGAIQGQKTYITATSTKAIINGDHALLMCYENHKGTLKGCDFLGVGTYDGEIKPNSHSEPDVWVYYVRPVDHTIIREHWKVSGTW